jgi:hypothetical protein
VTRGAAQRRYWTSYEAINYYDFYVLDSMKAGKHDFLNYLNFLDGGLIKNATRLQNSIIGYGSYHWDPLTGIVLYC